MGCPAESPGWLLPAASSPSEASPGSELCASGRPPAAPAEASPDTPGDWISTVVPPALCPLWDCCAPGDPAADDWLPLADWLPWEADELPDWVPAELDWLWLPPELWLELLELELLELELELLELELLELELLELELELGDDDGGGGGLDALGVEGGGGIDDWLAQPPAASATAARIAAAAR